MESLLPPSNLPEVSSSAADTINLTTVTQQPKFLISDEVRVIMQWILYGSLLMVITSFGIASNIVNIICFLRQGLKDPVNVSLLGLAFSDLGSLLTSLGAAVCFHPCLQTLDLPVQMVDFVVVTISLPHFLFSGLTSWITALITLERCLCITIPTKVKSIITPRRVAIIISCLFLLLTCSTSSMYYVSELSWVFSPERNRTILRLVYTDDRVIVEQFSFYVNNGFIPVSAYCTIIICTFTLVAKLRNKAKWRQACTTSKSADITSKRDQKVSKMVMTISMVFIICLTPVCVSAISLVVVPELAIDGPNQNFLYIYGGIGVVLESANSSANIFIYYHMSSRYKFTFLNLCSCRKTSEK